MRINTKRSTSVRTSTNMFDCYKTSTKDKSKDTVKAVPASIDEIAAMPLMPENGFDKELEDEARLLDVTLQQMYQCIPEMMFDLTNSRRNQRIHHHRIKDPAKSETLGP